MTTYTFPSGIRPVDCTRNYVANTNVFQSTFSNYVQSAARGGEMFGMHMTFKNLSRDNAAELWAYLIKLNGQEHRILVPDFSYEGARGTINHYTSPVVDGGGQTGYVLNIKSGPVSETGYLKAGDQISVNSQLFVVTDAVNTDGAGKAAVHVRGAIHNSPADGDTVISSTPKGTFMLSAKTVSAMSQDQGRIYNDFTLDLMEDVSV